MLKGRKENDIYLATICRHPWSAQMTMKKKKKIHFPKMSHNSKYYYIIFYEDLQKRSSDKKTLKRREECATYLTHVYREQENP